MRPLTSWPVRSQRSMSVSCSRGSRKPLSMRTQMRERASVPSFWSFSVSGDRKRSQFVIRPEFVWDVLPDWWWNVV